MFKDTFIPLNTCSFSSFTYTRQYVCIHVNRKRRFCAIAVIKLQTTIIYRRKTNISIIHSKHLMQSFSCLFPKRPLSRPLLLQSGEHNWCNLNNITIIDDLVQRYVILSSPCCLSFYSCLTFIRLPFLCDNSFLFLNYFLCTLVWAWYSDLKGKCVVATDKRFYNKEITNGGTNMLVKSNSNCELRREVRVGISISVTCKSKFQSGICMFWLAPYAAHESSNVTQITKKQYIVTKYR